MVTTSGNGATVNESVVDMFCTGRPESVTLNVSEIEFAVAVGVPLITPLFEKLSPAGKVPLAKDQAYGGVPPFAAKVVE